METRLHIPVLLHEIIREIHIKDGGSYLDGTLGLGGHAVEIFLNHEKKIKVIGFDKDKEALQVAEKKLKDVGADPILFNDSFANIKECLQGSNIGFVDAILFDLGVSSLQLDSNDRGFSFRTDSPLIMTLDSDSHKAIFNAYDVVNIWEEEHLSDIIFGYGEERFAKKIAKAIVLAREEKPIKTTFELRDIVEKAVPLWYRHRKIHPATKTFQAIRIAVNDELGTLERGLRNGFDVLSPGGVFLVISFHSLEDRIVKRIFSEWVSKKEGMLVYKKPIVPKDEEIDFNKRARSAKLRIFKKSVV